MLRSALITATLAAAGTLAGAPAQSADAATPDTGVPFETLGIVSGTEGINLWQPELLRVRNNDDIEWARDLLSSGGDGRLPDRVIEIIGDIPRGRVVLIGVIDISCTPADEASLVRGQDGHLGMYAPGHVAEPIECFAPVVTVAVLSVDADDAPPGSTDDAELVAFEFVGHEVPEGASAAELAGSDASDESALASILPADATVPKLPPLSGGDRRFAFVLSTCGYTTAELIVTGNVITARPERDDPDVHVDCAQAAYSVAVFDLPSAITPLDAQLVGA